MRYISWKVLLTVGIFLVIIIVDQTSTPVINDAEGAQAGEICTREQGAVPPFLYTTDGCSMFPDGGWSSCCIAHDVTYWCGGSREDRVRADQKLRQCVDEVVPALGSLIYGGVRLGGHPSLPFPWRWGYGFPYPYWYEKYDE